jgi:hypothetical protein
MASMLRFPWACSQAVETQREDLSRDMKVEKAMRERKKGTLRSGRPGNKVRSRRQAIAIGLAQARRKGANLLPRPKKSPAKRKGKR